MADLTPLEEARRWWKERTDAERYVVASTESPSLAVARVLRQEGVVLDTCRRVWILLAPGRSPDVRGVFLAYYWPVVALALARYEPAAVAGVAAIRLHLEDFSPTDGGTRMLSSTKRRRNPPAIDVSSCCKALCWRPDCSPCKSRAVRFLTDIGDSQRAPRHIRGGEGFAATA